MTRRQPAVRLLVILASVCLGAPFAGSARGATPTEPGYACGLVDTGLFSAAYGKGLHVAKRPREVPVAFGEDSYGSGCTVIVTKKRKSTEDRRRSTVPARRIRVGKVQLVTVVAPKERRASAAAPTRWRRSGRARSTPICSAARNSAPKRSGDMAKRA